MYILLDSRFKSDFACHGKKGGGGAYEEEGEDEREDEREGCRFRGVPHHLKCRVLGSGIGVLRHSPQLSPCEGHICKTVSQELCPRDGCSRHIAAEPPHRSHHIAATVPAKAPGAVRLSLPGEDEREDEREGRRFRGVSHYLEC